VDDLFGFGWWEFLQVLSNFFLMFITNHRIGEKRLLWPGYQRDDKYRVLESLQVRQDNFRVPIPIWIQLLRVFAIGKRLIVLSCKPAKKSGTPFCNFTNRCRIDGKNHTILTDFNRTNLVYLFYSSIF